MIHTDKILRLMLQSCLNSSKGPIPVEVGGTADGSTSSRNKLRDPHTEMWTSTFPHSWRWIQASLS